MEQVLGRGRFAIVRKTEDPEVVVKEIEIDDQRPPHNWKAELHVLELVRSKSPNLISFIKYTKTGTIDPTINLFFPKLNFTLENIVFENAKANYPPGSGWRNAMPELRIKEILEGVLSGLQYVHGLGIIHRDIKPENIMFSNISSEPVLIDFGIAWVPNISEPEDSKYTDIGSYLFKAPELLMSVRNYNGKVDVWALGCILGWLMNPKCEMLFSPYKNDITLLAQQFKCLGIPNLKESLTFKNSSAAMMFSTPTEGEGELFNLVHNDGVLSKLLNSMLQIEPELRCDASTALELIQ